MLQTGYHITPGISIPVLCGGRGLSRQPVRQIRGCAAQGLEERKEEPVEKLLQEGAVYPGQERSFGGIQIFQDPEPQGFMRKEQGPPAVEGGDGYAGAPTQFLYTCRAKEIIPQHQEDEPQGIRRIGDQCTGEQGMRMAARTALITAYGHFMGDRAAIFPFNQITRIGSEWGETELRPADGTDAICMVQTFRFPFKPLPV